MRSPTRCVIAPEDAGAFWRRLLDSRVALAAHAPAPRVAEISDHAWRAQGAMGLTAEFPLQFMYKKVRACRIFEGPSEARRRVAANRLI